MSLITCCPACGTMFKVVPDQLRISEGWVRCGYCSDVFDASANLRDDIGAPWSPAPAHDELQLQTEQAPPLAAQESPPAEPAAVRQPGPDSGNSLFGMPPPGAVVHSAFDPGPESQRESTGLQSSLLPDDVTSEVPSSLLEDPAFSAPSVDSSLLEPDSVMPDVSFVRDAQRKAFWRRPLVRAMLSLVGLVLLLALAAQVVYFERDRIAAMDPRTRPWLELACQQLQCRIQPLRQIESIVIDNSSFVRIRDDAHRLNVTIRNTSPLEVAMPAFELALTDTQDQPVVRRIFTAAELGADATTLAAGADWSGSVAMAVGGGRALRVAGYRLLAFYP